jgi:hypothetical protein
MKPGTTITLPQEIVAKLIEAMQTIQQVDIDAQARDRAEIMQIALEDTSSTGDPTIADWMADEIQSILFDYWLNTPDHLTGQKIVALYKEVEALL